VLTCGFHSAFEMWIVILKKREYLEDIAKMERLKCRLREELCYVCLALSGDLI
jgi:hypothetical protein